MSTGEAPLPSGPSGAFGGSADDRRRPGRFFDAPRGPAGPAGPVVIDQTRLPSCPPYTAFVGNLPFDITEADLRTFFQMRDISSSAIVSVSLPRDAENKPRGFGYVEFSSVEDLTRALLASNQFQIRNRYIRVDFSEGKTRPEREVRAADASRNWRDGSSTGGAFGAPREAREPRPMSVAESNMNWRDGMRAAPVEPPKILPRRSEVLSAVEPMPNWRETSRPTEAKPVSTAPAPKPASKPAVESKVPAGSWRRE